MAISGTPAAAGILAVMVSVEDAAGVGAEQLYLLVIRGRALTLGPASLPGIAPGDTYRGAQLVANGKDVSFELAGGALPPGLSLDASGSITGTADPAAEPGVYPFLVRATDGAGGEGYGSFAIPVYGLAPVPVEEKPPAGCCGSSSAGAAVPALALVFLRRRRQRCRGENV